MKNDSTHEILELFTEQSENNQLCLRNYFSLIESKKRVCALLESRIKKNPQCLHCKNPKIVKNGYSASLTRYRCKSCGRTFNALTGTPLARLRKKELWLDYLQCLLNSLTIRDSAFKVQVNPKTAFKWRHRMLDSSHKLEHKHFSGAVEVAESYFRKSEKGAKELERESRKRGESASKRNYFPNEYVSVLFACDQNGHEADYITGLGPVKADWLDRYFKPHLSNDVELITGRIDSFQIFTKNQNLKHYIVLIESNEMREKVCNIKHVKSYLTQLKLWMGHFHGVATKYLNNYLGWAHELLSLKIASPEELLKLSFMPQLQLTGT